MRILTGEQMRRFDERTIAEVGVPGLVLMENAALGVVEAIADRFPAAASVAVFCGPGNNGGDGLAIARQLLVRGYEALPFVVRSGSLSADCERQLGICRALGLQVDEVADEAQLEPALAAARHADLVVDALFGTGLSRPLSGVHAAAVDGMARLGRPIVAVDVPSGLDAGSPVPPGPCIAADLTVALGALKLAHVFPPAAQACGEVAIADLGVPTTLIEEAPESTLELLTAADVSALLPLRQPAAHKGDHGHLLLVAGSPGKGGAAVLAARAAVVAGAGLVTVGVPEPLLAVVDGGSIESMTLAVAATSQGQLGAVSVAPLLAMASRCSALAVGPGTGADGETGEALRRLIVASKLPAVVDADGINAFAGRAEELRGRQAPTVLTPHPGELGRLLGTSTAAVVAERLASVREAARQTGAVVVLKGQLTLVASPAGPVAVNPTGNAGMASGGTGDVLTGTLGALLAQGLDAFDAACLAVYAHGLAGDLVARRVGSGVVPATVLAAELATAFRQLRHEAGIEPVDEGTR